MPTSDAVAKLTSCMENFLRESPEARTAMRELLDELDAEGAKPVTPPRSPAPAPRTPSPPPGVCYYGIKAFFDADPSRYGWTLVRGDANCRNVVFERRYPSAHVTLRYYFTTGTVQLVYPVARHPTHGDGQDTQRVTWDREEGEYVTALRLLQENYRGLEDAQFEGMLRNAPQWFGKGYLRA